MTKLLYGTIDLATGRIDPRPVIADMTPEGHVDSWHPLTGHEPHSTTLLPALLTLPALTLTDPTHLCNEPTAK